MALVAVPPNSLVCGCGTSLADNTTVPVNLTFWPLSVSQAHGFFFSWIQSSLAGSVSAPVSLSVQPNSFQLAVHMAAIGLPY